jgi:hypothetical protein
MTAPAEPKWTNAEIKPISESAVKKFKDIEKGLNTIKDRSAWHHKQYTTLSKRALAANQDMPKLKSMPNKKKGDAGNPIDPTKFTAEVDDIVKELKAALDKKVKLTYYYGTSAVTGPNVIETKAKIKLPKSDEKFASQAVNDAIGGTNPKDASSVAGTGVKHASSGTPGVGSCTVFFTWQDLNDGLERRFTVVAVGGHAGSASYTIYESFTPKLTVGKTVSL